MKKVLIISPQFPPINAPDLHRVRMSLPYYKNNGWEPVVLTVDEKWLDGVREPELAATVPPEVRVVVTRALPLSWSRRLGVGDLGLRAWPFLLWRGAQLLRREKFDLVFISNSQFMTFTLGRLWKQWFGVPYIIDVQDPWRTDYYQRPGAPRPPGGWKHRFARWTAWAFEKGSLTHANALMSVSRVIVDDLRLRYPEMAAKPTAILGFGATELDFVQARARPKPVHRFSRNNSEVHFVSTGAAGSIMESALSVLFLALRSYRARDRDRAQRLRFTFIGTSYASAGRGVASVLPIAARFGVEDQVTEVSHRAGFLEALRLQLDADALVLLGSNDLSYSPSKTCQYFLSGRPILAIVLRGGEAERLLTELSCAVMAVFGDLAVETTADAQIHRFFDSALAGFPAGSLPRRNDDHFRSHCLAEELTRRQCDLFDAALNTNSASPAS